MDLVWGPDIELIESKTTVHNFLGEGKYTPHLNSVYAGLGIPPTLTGTFGAAGTTNNFISLKTLTQRLQYGRDTLVSFWEKEIEIVQKAMGFKYAAKIEFDRMDLSNEDAEKALLIQLLDRNIISDEVVQSRFGFDPDMERTRVNREHRERKTNRTPPKSGPFYDPMIEETLKKVALQLGIVTPSQVGLDLPKKKSSEQTALEMKTVMPPKNSLSVKDSPESLKGIPQQGRPKNSKDSKQRKTKTFSPQTGAKLHIWANEAQEKISDIINPILLEFYQKKNMRSLSHEEYSEAEKIRTKLLLLSAPFSSMNEESIVKSFASLTNNSEQTYNLYLQFLNSTKNSLNRDLNVDDIKDIKSYFYSLVYDYENNGDIQ
jgi:hypothetical protein